MAQTARILRMMAFFFVTLSALPIVANHSYANHVLCSDGIDNDNDGKIDFPLDPDCSSNNDNTEEGSLMSSFPSSSSAASSMGISIGITDDRTIIQPGNSVIYAITLRQTTQPERNVDVDLYLPAYTNTVSPDQGGSVSGDRVRWSKVSLSQNQTVRLTASVSINPNTPQGTEFIARVTAAGIEATDTTVVQTGPAQAGTYQITVSDGKQVVAPNEELFYTISVVNTSGTTQIQDVRLTASQFLEITEIQPSTSYDALTIVWDDVELQPNQPRIFTIKGRVRRGAPEFVSINTQVAVGPATATDVTSVQTRARSSQSSFSSSSSSYRSQRSSMRTTQRSTLFLKTADTQEVMPGGAIRYTLYVQNVLLTTIDDAVITDRFDPSMLSVADAGGGILASPGQLQWTVPVLLPGQVWRQSYTLNVAASLTNGTQISNIANISGSDLAFATLEEKVTVVQTGIVKKLPSTGAAFDLLFVFMSFPLAFAGLKAQRKIVR